MKKTTKNSDKSRSCKSEVKVNRNNFDESAYTELNIDVKQAVQDKMFKSGYEHYKKNGKREKRSQVNTQVYKFRNEKNNLIKPTLNKKYDKKFFGKRNKFNFLNADIKEKFNITDTPNVSAHDYDKNALRLISKHKDGVVLDCGAGYRKTYYTNVINLDIVDYSTTDVVGVGEKLPFKDNSFDAIISIAVFEHVKDPFQCAKEISRVLKPGGELYCAVPFLQPFHGYPHHYFNMTKMGVRTLFEDYLDVEKQAVATFLPIYALWWIIGSWGEGLSNNQRNKFLNMKLKDFYHIDPKTQLNKPFVKELSEEKNFELASGTVLFAKKPAIKRKQLVRFRKRKS